MMVWEGEKTDCEGFEPTVVREVKFPTGSLVRSEDLSTAHRSLRTPVE